MLKFSLCMLIAFIAINLTFGQEKDIVFPDYSYALNDTLYNFDTLSYAEKARCTFKIKNLSNEPLVITHVTASCGCTEPAWTEKPIKQGKTGKITLEYDTARKGYFEKSAYIYTNRNAKPVRLCILGEVVPAVPDQRKSDQKLEKTHITIKQSKPSIDN